MIITIDTHSGVPIYRQALEQISQQILLGQLAVDEQLPSVRDLAKELKVNPMTISKVYSLLEVKGLAERRRGVGIFVKGTNARDRKRARAKISDEMIKNTAQSCVQYGVSEKEAIDSFVEFYRQYDSKHGGSNE